MGARKNRSSLRPIEALEPRALFTAIAWDAGGDGVTWTDPLNWSTNSVPTANDDVLINVASSDPVIRAVHPTTRNLTSSEHLQFSGTYKIYGDLTLQNTTL